MPFLNILNPSNAAYCVLEVSSKNDGQNSAGQKVMFFTDSKGLKVPCMAFRLKFESLRLSRVQSRPSTDFIRIKSIKKNFYGYSRIFICGGVNIHEYTMRFKSCMNIQDA